VQLCHAPPTSQSFATPAQIRPTSAEAAWHGNDVDSATRSRSRAADVRHHGSIASHRTSRAEDSVSPPRYGADELSNFWDAARSNQFGTFVNKRPVDNRRVLLIVFGADRREQRVDGPLALCPIRRKNFWRGGRSRRTLRRLV
jgi:hypothetical protein